VKNSSAIWVTLFVLCALPAAQAQRGGRGGGGAAAAAGADKPEEGIPVTDTLTISKCGTCHAKDEKGNLGRISWERSTPEGWEEAIKRMVRLNGLTISPVEARSIVKYLATHHGLAPEEAKPVMYMPEHRMLDTETIIPNDAVRGACSTCHAFGRGMSWRRSKTDWQYLENMHSALYAQADGFFHRPGRGGGGGGAAAAPAVPAAPAGPEPGVAAIDYLSTAAPLHTPEWSAWSARMRAPRITGKWLVSASISGKGKFYGDLTIEAGPAEDEFKTITTLRSVKDNTVIKRTGTAIVYAGYSWRGRSKGAPAANAKPDDLGSEARETLWIAPDQNTAVGRWYWGQYQEFGFDVNLVRASSEPAVSAVTVYSLKVGSKDTSVKVYGDSFPANIALADLDFGAGVKVTKIVSHTKTELVATVDVNKDAVPGKRDVGVGRSVLQNAYAVYDKVDYIKVTPDSALARLGGGSATHIKGYQQFEAVAYANGNDGKPHTADDVELGPIDASWSVEEFMAVFGDDDKNFVGNLDSMGFFTPAADGPNPERKFMRNNYGDVWVVATAKNEKGSDGKPLSGRSYLVVTVPTYINWDQPEVGQ
jgi:quinohemoprotein amine dehydrogenase